MILVLVVALLAAAPLATATCSPKVEEIRDARNRLAGTLHTRGDCTVEARDHAGRLPGRYNPRSHQTRDAQGRLVSTANTLPVLIWTAGGKTKPRSVMSKCRYCSSTSYGYCLLSPHKKHEHIEDEKRCEFCGSSSYGSCLNSPTKKHRHGSGANKCRWCGSTSTGNGCLNSPSGKHER